MNAVFHEGEREVQRLAGVEAMARRVGNGIHAEMPDAAQDFLSRQPFVVIGGAGEEGAVWAGILTGQSGFACALDSRTAQIDALPNPADPLHAILTDPSKEHAVGLLAIEPHSRRRMRVNGVAKAQAGGFLLHVRQAYANCPKYIQARRITAVGSEAALPSAVSRGAALTEAQQAKIGNADTFFIASAHAEGGADASHRGGNPGFVEVENANTLLFPDYSGNKMFNTLGNLIANPRAGLLFTDFATGATLQLTGEAEILWDADSAARFPGAERVVRFRVAAVIEIEKATVLRGVLESFSPFNPA